MTSKEKLYYLLKEYLSGNYNTNSFCDQFTLVFDIETEYETLTELEKKVFGELCKITSRFSPYEEDLKVPNSFAKEQEVKAKAFEAFNLLM